MSDNLGWRTNVCPDMERRIVFLGRTGSGKSATGNNILNKTAFESSTSGASVTKKCQRGTALRNGRNIQIIDSPGLFDTEMTNEEITREVIKCVGMTAPGPHAFVLVVRIDRFTEEEQKTVAHFRNLFGDGMLNYLIILFTRKDDLLHDNKTLETYLRDVPQTLKDLVRSCNNRYIAFNNRAPEAERARDVEDFLNMADRVLMENCGRCYTNDMYEEAEKTLKKREEKFRREQEEVKQREKKEMEKQFQLRLQQQYEEQSGFRKQLEQRVKELEQEKVVAKRKEEERTMRELSKELEELKLAIKESKAENAKAEEQLCRERERMELQARMNAKAQLEAFRETEREEINKESGFSFTNLLTSTLPVIIGGALSSVVGKALPVAGAFVKGLFKR